MIILIKLLLAHFIGDFVLQPKTWADSIEIKKVKSFYLYGHLLIHGLLVWIVLWNIDSWRMALSIMMTHGLIDTINLYAQKESNKSHWFLFDQTVHIVSIIIIWILLEMPSIIQKPLEVSAQVWIYLTAILFLTAVSSIWLRELMSTWSKAINEQMDESLNDAGKYIGMLERLFVFVFVITNHWEGIGFLLAAKSVFRFGDLKESKDRKLTEYILIGTLLSFGIATFTGMVALWLEKHV